MIPESAGSSPVGHPGPRYAAAGAAALGNGTPVTPGAVGAEQCEQGAAAPDDWRQRHDLAAARSAAGAVARREAQLQ